MEKDSTSYPKENRALALFDFDGTITTRDTFIEFIIYSAGTLRFLTGFTLLSPILLAYKAKLLANSKAKEKVLTWFFKGWSYDTFLTKGNRFCENILPGLIRPAAAERLKWHKEQGHRIIIVTASVQEWVQPWCEANSYEILATGIGIQENKLTGKLSTPNCYGPEKVNRIKKHLDLTAYDTIYAYGDTKGDREMLAIAGKKYYRHFH